MIEHSPLLQRMVRLALEEDLGQGDITTDAIIDPSQKGAAHLLAKERLILAGLPVFKDVFLEISSDISFNDYVEEGTEVQAGQQICMVSGQVSSILKAERTALNFLQRLSGIATLTNEYVKKATMANPAVKVLDTRKTMPGQRSLDKYAVKIGGGYNHRFGLYDGILIKDNHISAAGSITRAIKLSKEKAPHTIKIEVEVEDLSGAKEAMEAGADIILLDNMTPGAMRDAVNLAKGKVKLEASGGVNLESIEEIAATGIDYISVGALTHSARAVDFSLEILPESNEKGNGP